MRYCLLSLCLLLCCIDVQASCGMVNGVYVCTDKPGCGLVNGVEVCAEPKGCGYVNGAYTCTVADADSPVKPGVVKPKDSGSADASDAGVVAGLEWLADFFAGDGSDDWLSSAISWGVKKAVVAWLDTKLWAMKIAWGVARSILTDLGVFAAIASAVTAIPGEILSALNFFRVFEAISMMLTAGMTKFVLRFMPGV